CSLPFSLDRPPSSSPVSSSSSSSSPSYFAHRRLIAPQPSVLPSPRRQRHPSLLSSHLPKRTLALHNGCPPGQRRRLAPCSQLRLHPAPPQLPPHQRRHHHLHLQRVRPALHEARRLCLPDIRRPRHALVRQALHLHLPLRPARRLHRRQDARPHRRALPRRQEAHRRALQGHAEPHPAALQQGHRGPRPRLPGLRRRGQEDRAAGPRRPGQGRRLHRPRRQQRDPELAQQLHHGQEGRGHQAGQREDAAVKVSRWTAGCWGCWGSRHVTDTLSLFSNSRLLCCWTDFRRSNAHLP
ncbi:hypothetical protein TPAR_02412, partial [Tolypocladium paradoxum]